MLTATSLTPPSIDGHGEVWAVEGGGTSRVIVIPPGGRPTVVSSPELAGFDVSRLRVSRDGARVAVVAARAGARPRLLVGRVSVRAQGGLLVDGFRSVAPRLRVTEVSWAAADRLAVLGAAHGVVQPWSVAVDGSEVAPVATTGLLGYLDIAAAPELPLVVSFARGIYQADQGGWTLVAHGGEPAYPG